MLNAKDLANALVAMQHRCIGLYYNPYIRSCECVVEESDYGFVTLYVGGLLGLSTTHYSKDEDHQFTRFPDGKTMADMMDEPFAFDQWYKAQFK